MASFCMSRVLAAKSLLTNDLTRKYLLNAARTLFTPRSMGMEQHIYTRDKIKSTFAGVEEVFRKKMTENLVDNQKIFLDDLRHMSYLVSGSDEDLELYSNMVRWYVTKSPNANFGGFNGSVVMRTLYLLNKPDVALKLFKDPQLVPFFSQIVTIQLLLDMLYNSERYKDCRETYDYVKQNNFYPQNALAIVFGACYKENTLESFEYACRLHKELEARGVVPLRRRVCFLAALALNQGRADLAFEVSTHNRDANHILLRNLRALADLELGNFSDMAYLFNLAFIDNPGRVKHVYCIDVLTKIEEKMSSDKDSEIYKLLQKIAENNLVESKTLDEFLCTPIDTQQGNRNSKIYDLKKKLNKNRERSGESNDSESAAEI